eukprot:12847359-Alexandrium_andersonii.AAC.1
MLAPHVLVARHEHRTPLRQTQNGVQQPTAPYHSFPTVLRVKGRWEHRTSKQVPSSALSAEEPR